MGLDVIKQNLQIIILILIWTIVGAFAGPLAYVFIPLTLFLLFFNERFPEILFGFIVLLVLSDSLEVPMSFAKGFKNIYIILLFLFLLANLKKIEIKISLYKYFIPYFIFGLIGLMFSPVFNVSIQKLLSYIILFITVPTFVAYCYQLRGKYFFRELIYLLLAIIVIGYLLRFVWIDVAFSHGGRLRGIFGNPNGLGIFMVVFFLLYSVVRIKYRSLFNKYENIVIIIIVLYITYRTGSRAALMAILLYFLFSWLFRISFFVGLIFFFLTLISMELLMVYFPQIIISLGLEKSFRLDTLEEGSGRLIAWEFAWENIQKSFFIGKGLAFDEHLMRSNFEMLSKEGHEGGVHNTYLIIWLNTGLLGLIAFLRGFFYLFLKASKKYTQSFPVMLSIMLSINFEPWLSASLNPYTIIYLIIITLLTEDYFVDESNETTYDEEVESPFEMV